MAKTRTEEVQPEIESLDSFITRVKAEHGVTWDNKDIIQVATVCHITNLAYCQTIGDDSQVGWSKAPDYIKQSALSGVIMHLADHNKTPEQSHQAWMEFKINDGWVYGETKDNGRKTHPSLKNYEELDWSEKIKDYLFRNVVHAFLEARGELNIQKDDVMPGYLREY